MTVRTWRQARTVMAAADAELAEDAVEAAVDAAARRWGDLPAATLLAAEEDFDTARELAARRPELLADTRVVNGIRDAGWAVAWALAEPAADGA